MQVGTARVALVSVEDDGHALWAEPHDNSAVMKEFMTARSLRNGILAKKFTAA